MKIYLNYFVYRPDPTAFFSWLDRTTEYKHQRRSYRSARLQIFQTKIRFRNIYTKKNLANEEMYIQSFHNFPVSQACGKRWNSNLPLIPSLCSLENRNLLCHESLFIFGKRYCPYLYRHLMHLSTNTAFCFFFFSHDYRKIFLL